MHFVLCSPKTVLPVFVHRHQLQCPGQYSPLEAFYEDKKAVLQPSGNSVVSACPTWSVTNINRCMHPEMKVYNHFHVGVCSLIVEFYMNMSLKPRLCPLQITHPAGCMSQFIQFFGEQIMVLWKFALLRKRLLIFSPPPVGVVCYRGEQLKHKLTHTHKVKFSQLQKQIWPTDIYFYEWKRTTLNKGKGNKH